MQLQFIAVSWKPEPCRCRAFALKMFITLFWSPEKSLLQLLFLASYLCSALQDTVEQTVIYSRNFTCKIHYIIAEGFILPRIMSTPILRAQLWWQYVFTKPGGQTFLHLPQLLSLPLCLSILFLGLIFVGKCAQKNGKKIFWLCTKCFGSHQI